MWTPNITTPVVKMLCHRGPINALAFDVSGHYMVTAGKLHHEELSCLQSHGGMGGSHTVKWHCL